MLTPTIILAPCLWIQKSQFSHSWWGRGTVYPSLVHLTRYFNLFVLSSWLKFLENSHAVLSIFLSPGQSTWASNLDGIVIVIVAVTLLYAIIHSTLQSAVRNLHRQWESYQQGDVIGRGYDGKWLGPTVLQTLPLKSGRKCSLTEGNFVG